MYNKREEFITFVVRKKTKSKMMTSRTTGSTKKLIMWYKVNELFSNGQTERNWKDLQIQSVMMFIIII